MATIVNARDVILQAAAVRTLPVALPPNIVVPAVQVSGLGALATKNTVLPTEVTGLGGLALKDRIDVALDLTAPLTASNITGLGALATLSAVNASTQVTHLGSLAFANTIAADQIGAGQLAAGVVYAGSVLATQITTGTLTAATVNTSSYIRAYGSTPSAVDLGIQSLFPSVYGEASRSSGVGVVGAASAGPGVLGKTTHSEWSAIVGWGLGSGSDGVYGAAVSATGVGVHAENTAGGVALRVTGRMEISSAVAVANLNADLLDGNHASAFAAAGHTHNNYVPIAAGRSSGDYIYAVDFSAPSNQTTRAGWVRLATNAAGGGVWVPYYL